MLTNHFNGVVLCLFATLAFCASDAAGSDAAYPLKIGPTGRYLVDQKGTPFLIAGESPQGMMVNVSEKDAEKVTSASTECPLATARAVGLAPESST